MTPHGTTLFGYVAATLVAFVAISLPGTASAEHRTIHLDIDSISVRADGGYLHVDYRVGGEHWGWVEKHGVGLRIEARPVFRHSSRHGHERSWRGVGFSSRHGAVRIPWRHAARATRGIQIRIASPSKACTVNGLRYGGLQHSYLRLTSASHHHFHYTAAHHKFADDIDLEEVLAPNLVELCDANTLGKSRRDTCLKHVFYMDSGNVHAQSILATCAQNVSLSDDFVDCVERGSWFHSGAAAAIRSCGQNTDSTDYFNQCVHWASHVAHHADTVVRTCAKRQGSFDANVVECVSTAAELEPDAHKSVEVCDRLHDSRYQFEQCLAKVAGK